MILIQIEGVPRLGLLLKWDGHAGGESKKVIGLVGKGLTFDSGGYNLKVGVGIEMMKFDMGGAAAVFGAAQAIAALKPKGVTVRTCSNPFSS